MKDIIVSPSVLGATLENLPEEINRIKNAGIQWVHFDVMDGKFVKNVSFSSLFLEKVCANINLVKDVHIMIENPLDQVESFAKCGIDYLTFHYEACKDDDEVIAVIDKIHSFGVKAGVSIKPKTPLETIYPFLSKLDLVLIMSVEPGMGGQRFIESSLERIALLKKKIITNKFNVLVSVDGGINDKTAPECIKAGADVLVVGQYLFGREDYLERYQKIIKQ